MKVVSIVGGRPHFLKAAAVSPKVREHNEEVLVHTGRPEDLAGAFEPILGVPKPDVHLGVEPGSHAVLTAEIMKGLERVFTEVRPELVLVYGDADASLAGALTAAKMQVPLGHVEAGVRSHDRAMPEEVNRVVTDHLSALLFCPTQTAVDNLAKEGLVRGVQLVGDVLYDVALQMAQPARTRPIAESLGLTPGEFVLVTLRRPENVDDPAVVRGLVDALVRCDRPIVFPVDPRTRRGLGALGLWDRLASKACAIEPVGYLDFLALLMKARKVVTDSGGVQREAYFFGVPCITVRDETEWIETVEDGWNALVGSDPEDLLDAIERFNPVGTKSKSFGDGRAAEHIARAIDEFR